MYRCVDISRCRREEHLHGHGLETSGNFMNDIMSHAWSLRHIHMKKLYLSFVICPLLKVFCNVNGPVVTFVILRPGFTRV